MTRFEESIAGAKIAVALGVQFCDPSQMTGSSDCQKTVKGKNMNGFKRCLGVLFVRILAYPNSYTGAKENTVLKMST